MTRWDRRLARLLRALIACTVLLFAAQLAAPGSAVAFEPVRDVSAWLAVSRVSGAAAPSVAQRASLRQARSVPARPEAARSRAARSRAARAQLAAPRAAASRSDERYLYLDLQTLLC